MKGDVEHVAENAGVAPGKAIYLQIFYMHIYLIMSLLKILWPIESHSSSSVGPALISLQFFLCKCISVFFLTPYNDV